MRFRERETDWLSLDRVDGDGVWFARFVPPNSLHGRHILAVDDKSAITDNAESTRREKKKSVSSTRGEVTTAAWPVVESKKRLNVHTDKW